MSNTPETDARLRSFISISKYKKHFVNRTGTINADFARGLERERDEARRALELIAEDCESWLASECDEPSAEFIKLVAKFAREKLSGAQRPEQNTQMIGTNHLEF